MKTRAVIDNGIGETRIAVYQGRRLVELFLRRWSDKGRPRLGDIFAGRITNMDKSIGGAFVDLGIGPHGVLKFTDTHNLPRLTEGQIVKVEISREAVQEKGPILKFLDLAAVAKPMPLVQISFEDFLKRRFGPDTVFEEAPVNFIDDISDAVIALPGGGDIAIERTRALIAIDVDKGSAQSGFEVAKNAAPIIAQQLRLRGLGGLIAIDFPNIRQPKQREQLFKMMQSAFDDDPNPVKIAPLSRFGVLELTRAIKVKPVDEQFDDKTITGAMRSLRRLEREAQINPGAQLLLTVPHYIYNWLEADEIGWKAAMTDKIGARFSVEPGSELTVKADR